MDEPISPQQFPEEKPVAPQPQIHYERRLQDSLREIDMRRDRIKRTQPMSIIPLVLVLGIAFVGLLLFTIFRSLGGSLGSGNLTPTAGALIPRLETLPAFTNQVSLDVKGKTNPNTEVQIVINDLEGSILSSDQYGDFNFRAVSLQEGENRIKVRLANSKLPAEERESKEAVITYDSLPPTITLNQLPESTSTSPLTVAGQTDAYELFIDGTFIHITPEGTFETLVNLSDGANTLEIKARDQAGNETIKTVTITYTGKTTPTEEAKKSPTKAPTSDKTPSSNTATPVPTKFTPVSTATPKPTSKATNTPNYYIITPRGE